MNAGKSQPSMDADINLQCSNLALAQDFYIREQGFRLDMIYPADNPRVALLSGYGICIRLECTATLSESSTGFHASVVVQRNSDDAWGEGRAGMQYRDLIPDRLGGKYIASHIRIQAGGPVPDYVHHHDIRFQLIYCYRGWVRVVYEDQGPPFVMHAGDCVLQPPHIRHRVLECSDGMEVVEITCPAEHETLVEHEFELPTKTIDVDRQFSGQKFVFHRAADSHRDAAALTGFTSRNTGIVEATSGIVSAAVIGPSDGTTSTSHRNNDEFFFAFVLGGAAKLVIDGEQFDSLTSGDSFVAPPNSSFTMDDISSDLEILQVTSTG